MNYENINTKIDFYMVAILLELNMCMSPIFQIDVVKLSLNIKLQEKMKGVRQMGWRKMRRKKFERR